MFMDILLIVVLACAGTILLLFVFNAISVGKSGAASPVITRLIYIVAIMTVALNMYRMVAVGKSDMIYANIIALICILVSWVRSEKAQKQEQAGGLPDGK